MSDLTNIFPDQELKRKEEKHQDTSNPTQERLLTVPEVAQYLNLSLINIRKRCSEKTIPFYKFGAAVRFDRHEIDSWKKQHRVEPLNTRGKHP